MGFGRGRGGWGRGGGRGWRRGFYATGLPGWQRAEAGWPAWGGAIPPAGAPSREQQMEAMKGQVEFFEGALNDLRRRIKELEDEKQEQA